MNGLKDKGAKTRGWSLRIFVRYMLLQVPGVSIVLCVLFLIRQWIPLSTVLILVIVLLWIVKDLLLFPLLWRAYDWEYSQNTPPMVGTRGIARELLSPEGYIQVHGELWKAKIHGARRPVAKGEPVKVCGIDGLTLFVVPDEEE